MRGLYRLSQIPQKSLTRGALYYLELNTESDRWRTIFRVMQRVASYTGAMLALAKLYTTIAYFYPGATERWREATEKLLPGLLTQPTPERLGEWLAALGDSESRVLVEESRRAEIVPGYSGTTREGLPLLTLPDAAFLREPQGEQLLAGFLSDASRARGAILDLTATQAAGRVATERFATLTEAIAEPALWQRAHYGKVPEAESATGGFRTGWLERDAQLSLRRWPPTAFLVTRHTSLPPFALALVQLGRGAVFFVGEGELPEIPLTVTWALDAKSSVRVRTGLTAQPIPGRYSDTVAALSAAREWGQKPAAQALRAPELASYKLPPPPQTRLHAALRLWGTLWLLHPEREKLRPELERALPGFLGEVRAATTALAFHKAVRKLLRRTGDGHAVTLTPLDGLLFGSAAAAVRLQMVEGKSTIVALCHPAAEAGGARVGDVITAVDGARIAARRAQLDPYLAAGTPQARENYLSNRLLAGDEGSIARLRLEGGKTAAVPRLQTASKERGGDPVRLLAGGAVYADLDRLIVADIEPLFARFGNAPTLIFDLRGYVDDGVAWELAPHLARVDQAVAVKFIRPVALPPEGDALSGRGLEEVFYQHLPTRGRRTPYTGKLIVLVDERTQSQSEHTALFLIACGALLIGSPTAGAVGDVTNLILSDGIVVRFSGQDVRFPEGRKVAGVGIMPQKLVRPTRRGLQAGRDEVLEAALKATL